MADNPPDLSQILPPQPMPDLGQPGSVPPNLAGSPGSPQAAAAANRPPVPQPILQQLIQGLARPQMVAPAPGEMARPVSRLDTFEHFLGNFVQALGQGMAAARGPGAFGKGFGAAAAAPYQQSLQQFQVGQQAQANQAEIAQRQAQTQMTQAQASAMPAELRAKIAALTNQPRFDEDGKYLGLMNDATYTQYIRGKAAAGINARTKETVNAEQISARNKQQADALSAKWAMQTRELQNKIQTEQMRQSGQTARQNSKQQNQLTTSTRTMIEMAPTVKNRVADIRALINDPELRSQLGPGGSRWSEMWAGKVGASDPKFTQLRSQAMLLQTALMRMHVGARGSKDMMQHFQSIIDTGKQSPENMEAALGVIDKYADEKIAEGQQGTTTPKGPAPPSGRRIIDLTK